MIKLVPDDLDSTDQNIVVLHLVKQCSTFIPHGVIEIRKKMQDMKMLFYLWDMRNDKDYSADVYAAAVDMFAANAFRPLPPSAYADDEDAGAAEQPAAAAAADFVDARGEAAQTAAAHTAFQAFVGRERFDAATAAAHVDRRFAGRLAHRLNSADGGERPLVCDTMGRLWRACPPARGRLLDAAVAELAELAYGYAPRHNGTDELFDFLADAVADDAPAGLEKLFKVLIQLLKHQSLYRFTYKLVECIKAFSYNHPDLVFRIMESIVKLWSSQNRKILLRVMIELYEWCVRDKWISLQLRVVGYLSKLFYDEDFQLAELAMNFWNRILHDNITFWQCQDDDIRIVVNALKKVIETHWNSGCAKMATDLLNLMMSKNVTKNYCDDIEKLTFQHKNPDLLTYYRYNHILQVQLNNFMIDKPTDKESTV